MSPRPRVVEEHEGDTATAEFDVDSHGAESAHTEPTTEAPAAESSDVTPAIVIGWTPEEATALVCALWNLGILIYGPEWTADPRETIGWNIAVAQLLDMYVPKDTGGMVQTGAGLLMIGNGVMMMGARRFEIIKRGPRPIWVRKAAPNVEAEVPPAPRPSAPASNGSGTYHMPADLAPKPDDSLSGLGL
jgi:hypothetical protein